ncbi:Transposase IS4 [Popillia japonica]|uniref:Transposase IS4 n=1 Tax=Popillia japonica TaxID=7064 RepID=A0AAW1LV53_POPJA
MKWYEKVESEDSDIDEVSEFDIESEHDTNSEFDASEDDESDDEVATVTNYYGRNPFKWVSEPLTQRSRTPRHNIVTHLPGLRGEARNIGNSATAIQIWKCLLSDNILEQVLKYINEKLSQMREKFTRPDKSELNDIDMIELRAFLGLLYYSSVFKSNNEELQSLFVTDDTGRDNFRCVMSLKRMLTILACLRFDNKQERRQRIEEDPAAAISLVFSELVQNCQTQYSVGELTCIDEMLVGFRGRVKFRVYMPNKPNKYGIKILALTDA